MPDHYVPRVYQKHATDFIINNPLAVEDGTGIFLDMGLGKTVSTLVALDYLVNQIFDISKPLIIAPKKVAEDTWSKEIEKWHETKHLKLVKILGTPQQRIAALRQTGDIYIINRENISWLVSYYGLSFPFDMVVIDESSSFKNEKSQRFIAMKSILPCVRRMVIMTGTPAGNGLIDLWAQIYLLDKGKRLEKSFNGYRGRYFKKDEGSDYPKYEIIRDKDEKIGEGYYEKKIYNKVSDICISMRKEDWLDLPERIDIIEDAVFPDKLLKQYKEFEKERVLEIADEVLTAANMGALVNKLLQFANGAVYNEGDEGSYTEVHNLKIEMLGETIEAAQGKPMLVTYQFRSDVERIKKYLKEFNPVHINDNKHAITDWNNGRIRVLLGHPASMGHGLNLQFGSNLLTRFGAGWSAEQDQQVIARIHRYGVSEAVVHKRIISMGTWEKKVLERLTDRSKEQQSLKDALRVLINEHTKG